MEVLVIGAGVIGSLIVKTSQSLRRISRVYIFDKERDRAVVLARKYSKGEVVDNPGDVVDRLDFAVEAAGQDAVKAYLPLLLSRGVSTLVMSVGALVEEDFRVEMDGLALANKCKVCIPSGAIAGLDGIISMKEAPIKKVVLTTIKHPKSLTSNPWMKEHGINLDDLKEPTIVYQGTAAEAVRVFPRNINVAAALSIAGIGFKETRVKIVADPKATTNTHIIDVEGEAGSLHIECKNVPSPENPRTSYLAALSAVSSVRRLGWGFQFL